MTKLLKQAAHKVAHLEPQFHLLYLIGGTICGYHEVTAGILAIVVVCHMVSGDAA